MSLVFCHCHWCHSSNVSIYLFIHLSIYFLLFWVVMKAAARRQRIKKWRMGYRVDIWNSVLLFKLTLPEKYCLFFECTVLSYSVELIRNRHANADDNVCSLRQTIEINEWESMCACVLCCCCCWCRHGVRTEECAHRTTTPSYHHLITKIIATNSMFKPDLKKTRAHIHRHAIFCVNFSVDVVVAARLNATHGAIIHAPAHCVCVDFVCVCRFSCCFIILTRSLFERWLNVLAPHSEIDRKAHYPIR